MKSNYAIFELIFLHKLHRNYSHKHIGKKFQRQFWLILVKAAESQKPCQRVSNADPKVFANLESFCYKFIIG